MSRPIRWTADQLKAIHAQRSAGGDGILVSAAAGSGKTEVLAQRCAHLVGVANPPCDVHELLVVTFTESAADEMKSRIHKALAELLVENPSARLRRQLAWVEHAQVSTLHSFCYQLLRQNFNLAGLDPAFEILDQDEALLLQLEVADELFHRRYDADDSRRFQQLIDAYGNGDGDDLFLREKVVAAHAALSSLPDPGAWIAKTCDQLREAAEKPLNQSHLGKELLKLVGEQLRSMSRQCSSASASIKNLGPSFAPSVEFLGRLANVIAHWQSFHVQGRLDDLASEMLAYAQQTLKAPSLSSKLPNKELVKSLVDGVKDSMDIREDRLWWMANTSAQWQAGMVQTADNAAVFFDLVNEFGERFARAKRSIGAVDFNDLEHLTLRVLRQSPQTAKALREQFGYVLVDEYQDINPIQDEILQSLSHPPPNSNLFFVGDVKQSIFRFRLADPSRFIERRNKKSIDVIDLRENFRSRGPLLEAINDVFERLMTRESAQIEYDASHRLRPGRTFGSPAPDQKSACFGGAPIELHLLPSKPKNAHGQNPSDQNSSDLDQLDREAILLARRINQMMGREKGFSRMNVCRADPSGADVYSPIELGDIVILLRTMKNKAEQFAQVLRGCGIDVHNDAGGGFFESVEIRDMLCLLHVLDNQSQDIPLAAVLRSPLAGPLAGQSDAENALARIRLASPGPNVPFHQAVANYAQSQSGPLADHLRAFLQTLSQWRDLANKRPVAELIWQIYAQSGYLAYCAGLDDAQQRVANLLRLHERAAQFGSFLRQDLARFLRFLTNLRDEKDLGRASVAARGSQAVRIMSIHRAKGLEFPVVLLPDLAKGFNLEDSRGSILLNRETGLGMHVVEQARHIRYPSMASLLAAHSLDRQTLAEELRLLYVAMTRAREHLIMVGTTASAKLELWSALWSARPGALPADVVQGATNPLDWLGPVMAMTASKPSPPFALTAHTLDEVRAWHNPFQADKPLSEKQRAMAGLVPLETKPNSSAASQELARRFDASYAFDRYTRQAASVSVTSLAKSPPPQDEDSADALAALGIAPQALQALPELGPPPLGPSLGPPRQLDLPDFFAESAVPRSTDIGTATHLVLQHLDFAQAGNERGGANRDRAEQAIESQIESLVDRRFLSAAQAAMVDRKAIAWFIASPLGQTLLEHHDALLREVPFALAARADGSEPQQSDPAMDLVMIRGRIDLLVPLPAGKCLIVDYKTDNLTAAAIAAHTQSYRRQMSFYRRAVQTIAARDWTVQNIHLVFLSPRVTVTV